MPGDHDVGGETASTASLTETPSQLARARNAISNRAFQILTLTSLSICNRRDVQESEQYPPILKTSSTSLGSNIDRPTLPYLQSSQLTHILDINSPSFYIDTSWPPTLAKWSTHSDMQQDILCSYFRYIVRDDVLSPRPWADVDPLGGFVWHAYMHDSYFNPPSEISTH